MGSGKADKLFPQCKDGQVVAKPFIEFRWADVVRKAFAPPSIYTVSDQEQVSDFKSILPDAIKFALSPNASHLGGWNNNTPQYTNPVTIDSRGCVADNMELIV